MRLEARFLTFSGTTTGVATSSNGPALVFLPNIPVIRIVSVDGTATPDDPIGVFGGADIVVDVPGAVPVVLEAQRVPVDTTIQVTAKPESETEVIGPITSPGLTLVAGETTTTTVVIDFPVAGVYFLEARATFVQAP